MTFFCFLLTGGNSSISDIHYTNIFQPISLLHFLCLNVQQYSFIALTCKNSLYSFSFQFWFCVLYLFQACLLQVQKNRLSVARSISQVKGSWRKVYTSWHDRTTADGIVRSYWKNAPRWKGSLRKHPCLAVIWKDRYKWLISLFLCYHVLQFSALISFQKLNGYNACAY